MTNAEAIGLMKARWVAHPHGSYVRYRGGCRCDECRAGDKAYRENRKSNRAEGKSNAVVSAARSRAHLQLLSYVSCGAIARATGLDHRKVARIRSGKQQNVRESTERLLLTVERGAAKLNGLVNPHETAKGLRALRGAGLSDREINRRLGKDPTARVINGAMVQTRTVEKVKKLVAVILGERVQQQLFNSSLTEVDALPPRVCPECPKEVGLQPARNFGRCRARKDGRNLYCLNCIRQKVKNQRRAFKEYRLARTQVADTVPLNSPMFPLLHVAKLSPVERVKEAIRKGARTRREIALETRIVTAEIDDALVNLLLWTREIKTRLDGQTRHYFMNDPSVLPLRDSALGITPPRQPDVISVARTHVSAKREVA